MPTYNVTQASLTADVITLTLTSVSGLKAGLQAVVSGIGHPYDGTHTLTAVTTTDNLDGTYTYTITFAQNHVDIADADVAGEVYVTPTWCDANDVEGFLGVTPAAAEDVAWLDYAVAAGNDWAYDRRQAAGYTDLIESPPSQRAKTGTIMKAAEIYRQRGSFGSYQQYSEMDAIQQIGASTELLRMLGIPRPVIA